MNPHRLLTCQISNLVLYRIERPFFIMAVRTELESAKVLPRLASNQMPYQLGYLTQI